MKNKLFVLLSVLSFVFAACSIDSESNTRPNILFVKSPITTKNDTLDILLTDQAGVYKLDTIRVGDTVNFKMFVNGYTNNLTSFYLTESADSVTRILLPSKVSMDSVFLPTSNYSTGKFLMNGASSSLYFPFKYVARKPSKEAKLVFSVVSDAKFEYNQYSFELKTPVLAAKK